MTGATQRTAAQVYETDVSERSDYVPGGKLTCVGRISDLYWDDAENRFLRGFTLVDSNLAFGKGLSTLNYYHQPYLAPDDLPRADMRDWAINKYVLVTFQVFDSYEEASNGRASIQAGCPCVVDAPRQ